MRDILKNFALFVDGRGYAGDVEEFTPPPLNLLTEEMRNGGMDAPIDVEMGMEKMEANFLLTRYDAEILRLYGLAEGASVPLTARGSLKSEIDGSEKPLLLNMRGRVKSIDEGTWKAGEAAKLRVTLSLNYYKRTINGSVVHEIDVVNMVRIVGGVDQLAATRANLGL